VTVAEEAAFNGLFRPCIIYHEPQIPLRISCSSVVHTERVLHIRCQATGTSGAGAGPSQYDGDGTAGAWRSARAL